MILPLLSLAVRFGNHAGEKNTFFANILIPPEELIETDGSFFFKIIKFFSIFFIGLLTFLRIGAKEKNA
jgi:hypothetical protein